MWTRLCGLALVYGYRLVTDRRRGGERDSLFVTTNAIVPTTTLITPGGKPASCASCARASAESGATASGRQTVVQPAASAGAIFLASIAYIARKGYVYRFRKKSKGSAEETNTKCLPLESSRHSIKRYSRFVRFSGCKRQGVNYSQMMASPLVLYHLPS